MFVFYIDDLQNEDFLTKKLIQNLILNKDFKIIVISCYNYYQI